jgi:hypothetical protein
MISAGDMAHCRAAIRTGSLSFHAASRLLPPRVRDPALALYAFCRLADDEVDEGQDKTRAVLTLRDRLDLAYRGQPRNAPEDRAFAALVEDFAMPRALPEALLEGLAWDATGRQYDTLSGVLDYSARVAAAVGAAFIGTFQGVEFIDSDGRRRVSNKWTGATAGTEIVAYVTIDQSITYQIQSNAALAVTDIGKQFDFSAASGNTTTGLSSQTLDVASAAANAAVRLIGIVPGPDNAWGDTYVNALVQISEHQNTADVAAY